MEAVLEAAEAGAEFADALVVPAAVETDADVGTETPEELVTVVLSPPSVPMKTITEALGTALDFSLDEEELEEEEEEDDEDEVVDEGELDEELDDAEDVLDESEEEADGLDELSLESTDCPLSNFLISSCAWSYLPLTLPPSALMDSQEPD